MSAEPTQALVFLAALRHTPALIGMKRLVLGAHPIPKLNPMSHASRSATPNRAVRAPRSPLSVSSASTNEPPAGETTPIAPPTPAEECCCVCLERLSPAVQGAQLAVPFPAAGAPCTWNAWRNTVHKPAVPRTCSARSVGMANAQIVSPEAGPESKTRCCALCRRHGLAIPERLSGKSTVREAIRDYTLRTFTSSDAPEPPPPPGISVLCCQRLAAMGHAGGVDFVPLPHREMQWAPIPIRHGAGIAAWRPAWLCPGCAQEVRLDALQIPAGVGGPCNRCGAVTRWEYDRVTGRGTCSCTAGCAGPVNPSALTTPAPQPPAETTAPPVSAPAASQASRPTAAFWLSRGPPSGEVRDPTNSWLYVPLLHAAAADLAPTALDAWRTDPRTSDWWEHARQLLAASAPVTPQHLVAAFAQVAETAPAHVHHVPDLVARINNACLPTGACVHVGWAVRQLREQDGYLFAPVRNALAAASSHRPLIAIRTDFAPQLALHHRHCQRPDTPHSPPKRRWRRTTNQSTPTPRRPPTRRRRRTTNQPDPTRTEMTRSWRLPQCERVKQQFPEAPGVAAGDVDADAEPTHPHLTLTPHRPTRSRLPPNADEPPHLLKPACDRASPPWTQ